MATTALAEIIDFLGSDVLAVRGDIEGRMIRAVAPLTASQALTSETLTFCSGTCPNAEGFSAVILCHADAIPSDCAPGAVYLVCTNPRLAMIRVVRRFFAPRQSPPANAIDPAVALDPRAEIAENVTVAAYSSIGKCSVGSGTVIYAGVVLYDGVNIGRRVIIDAGAVIGADGFAYERNAEGALERFPHLGGVEIEDDVEIGSNATIDRGTFLPTVIRRGVKIDNLAYVAHNAVVGAGTMIMARAVVCGSVNIGERCWIAPSATIRDGVTIGNDVTVGLGAVVVRDVEDGATVYGVPARKH